MTRYARTVWGNRRACAALAAERRAREEETLHARGAFAALFEQDPEVDTEGLDFDRYQLAFFREPKGD